MYLALKGNVGKMVFVEDEMVFDSVVVVLIQAKWCWFEVYLMKDDGQRVYLLIL